MSGSSKKVIFAALAGNTLIALTKFAAAAFTGSSAMFSEGIHSLVDTGNQGLLLYGMRQAQKPADARFPFGHGKEIYFWSFVVAIMIFAVGAGVSFYEGVVHIIHPKTMENPLVNYIILGAAVLFEGWSWYVAMTEFSKSRGSLGYFEAVQRGKDPTMFVVLFEDTAALLGLMVALLGVLLSNVTGMAVFDGIASVIIGLILGVAAFWLAHETKGLLIGESASEAVVSGIRTIVAACAEVDQVNEVLTMHMGPEFVIANLSVDFRNDVPAGDLEATIARLDRQVKEAFPAVKRLFIEAEARRRAVA